MENEINNDFESFLSFMSLNKGHLGCYEKDIINFGCQNKNGELSHFYIKRPNDLIWTYINQSSGDK